MVTPLPRRTTDARAPTREHAYLPIGDYAVIGGCRTAALISTHGSIDWLCFPSFDSASVFAAVLDTKRGGRFQICPTGPFQVTRRYLGGSNILEAEFRTPTGRLCVHDAVPVASEAYKRRHLLPLHEVIRVIECQNGEVEIEIYFAPRPGYGRARPRLRERHGFGIACEHDGALLLLRSEVPLSVSERGDVAVSRIRLRAGERRRLSLTFAKGEPAVVPTLGPDVDDRLERSIGWWNDWSSRCRYDGPYREAVLRSALTLKLMTFAPSGALVAAPTTSLPEKIGGTRNWDYRYCWIRDASLTLQALTDLGYWQEGEAFLWWLLYSTRIRAPRLQVVYDVFGETHLLERELDHLEGYAGSRPVRVGNAAEKQLQLDTYGEVVDAVYEFVKRGGQVDRATARLLRGFGNVVCRTWERPDNGVWEARRERRHHTYSKAMCWVTLDRLIRLHERGVVNKPVDRFLATRAAIRDAIERHGFNERIGSYVSTFGGDEVDASLLLLGRYGYCADTSQRMRGTHRTIRERLYRDGLVYRYHDRDGLPPGEAAFGICSFWFVASQARQGHLDAAIAQFEQLLSYGNDVGLFSEEIDPDTGAALGNFPQAFTHVGIIDAALTIEEHRTRRGRPTQPTRGRV